jgi:N-formylglutamate deformylase
VEDFHVTPAKLPRVPVVLSIPHCGTYFPEEIRSEYVPRLIKVPDDTDWYVDRLYSFAASMGITVISARWSRWVIDLNRDPGSKPLYDDGRIITGLCPVTTFLGEPLYKDGRRAISSPEVTRRTKRYFMPYHDRLAALLADVKREFGKVLLWDCHSIRRVVPTIHPHAFPDLILGDADGSSAHPLLTERALQQLGRGDFSLSHNTPFKGGYITRHYGAPEKNQSALQLEMTKINYMDDRETDYHVARAKKMEELLYNTLSCLSDTLISLKD